MTLQDSTTTTGSLDNHKLTTGIPVLDNEILQGVPQGSTIAILGDPQGMAELVLHHLAHTNRTTHYISTVRPKRHIEHTINQMGEPPENLIIEDIHSGTENSDAIIRKFAGRLKDNHNLIIDTYSNAIHDDDPESTQQLLRTIYNNTKDNNALTYLYFTNNNPDTFTRAEREVLHMCDGIFKITTAHVGDSISTRLNILKLRGAELPDDQIKLNVGKKLSIDTTRDIA